MIEVYFSLISLLSSIVITNINPVIAQQELCRDVGFVEPSYTYRTLELPQFGINIDIPENYRAIAKNDGSIEILDAGNFELRSCIARGGKFVLPRGGTGGLTIRLVKNPKKLSVVTLVQREKQPYDEYYRYNLNGVEVIILYSPHFIRAWFSPPRINGVVVMEIGSDVELSPEDIVTELDRTKLR
jgi:hypothetical protein